MFPHGACNAKRGAQNQTWLRAVALKEEELINNITVNERKLLHYKFHFLAFLWSLTSQRIFAIVGNVAECKYITCYFFLSPTILNLSFNAEYTKSNRRDN